MYKQTAEYAFDLIEHFYKLNILFVEENGEENIEVLVPQEIYELLACRDKKTGGITYPTHYRKMDIIPYEGTTLDFVLKSKKKSSHITDDILDSQFNN